jgi:hypothetical protein
VTDSVDGQRDGNYCARVSRLSACEEITKGKRATAPGLERKITDYRFRPF